MAEGQEIAEDDPLVEIQTDKATVEIPSPAAGVVSRIHVARARSCPSARCSSRSAVTPPVVGEDVSGGQTQGHTPPPPLADVAAARRARATPLVRKVAQELGVELDSLAGTGPQGRITEEDVRAAAPAVQLPEGRKEPLRGVRRVIAEHMARAHREVPPVTWVEECDFGSVDMERLVAVVVQACAEELQRSRSSTPGSSETRSSISSATTSALPCRRPKGSGAGGPRVPHEDRGRDPRRADGAGGAGRAGELAPEELRGSTFTVTSAGKLGGLLSTPIVNYPEVAILSIGRIGDRPVVRDGEIVVRRTGTICVTFDHRVIDGARAAEFGLAVIARLEGDV